MTPKPYHLGPLLAITLLAACSSVPPAATSASADSAVKPAPAAAAGEAATARSANPPARLSIYFPFDGQVVAERYQQELAAHADYLMHAPRQRATIEGNADERGSREYNLALGQKRAEAVRRALSLRGVADRQIEAISYGEERPQAACHEERCWELNRRADLQVDAAARP
ncbi:peptidoglycan-associated lipoprotein Pal [Sulfurisoma sediminicola]|uniref:Peptidoglycan-associated lipoprotein n=1 Tax=Sulfurisoma sediminicola TaxID=1381557 RepID=A0A497XJX0_9PROT|nr:peptidoglycan-associated lipoprotein Pal [Sulfurisoma sediminicola]RLJ67675.1 peptidoglycan-associated lipoprotein [Sulfurisoma sediminicola]